MSTQQLVEFNIVDGNLRIDILDTQARAEIEEIAQTIKGPDNQFAEVIEYNLANSDWEYIRPEEIGALTSGLLLSDEATRDNQGNLINIGEVYWHCQYERFLEIEELLEQGYVELVGGANA